MYSVNASDHFNCSSPFCHDQDYETNATKWKGAGVSYNSDVVLKVNVLVSTCLKDQNQCVCL